MHKQGHARRVGAALLARALLSIVAVAALPAGLAAQQPAQAPVKVTLEQALAMAAERHPQMVAASGAVRTAAAAEKSALGAYLPSLSLSTSGSLSGTQSLGSTGGSGSTSALDATTGTRDSYGAGVSASWEVYSGGRRAAERQQARAQSTAAEASLVEQRYAVALEVERAFYEEQRTGELIGVAEARLQRAEQGVAAAERRFKLGSATRSDVLRAQLELNTAKDALLQARTDQANAALALGRLIGADGPADAEGDAPAAPAPLAVPEAELVAQIAAQAPTVRAAEASLRAADAGVDAARSQYRPSLQLSSGYDWSSEQWLFDDSRSGWQVSLGLSYPLFNGFQRAETVERARVQEQVARAEYADAQRGLRARAEQALGTLKLAGERIALTEQAVAAAREDLRVQQERYNLGATTMLELLSSQESLVQAETDRIGARYDYQVARAELQALAGREL